MPVAPRPPFVLATLLFAACAVDGAEAPAHPDAAALSGGTPSTARGDGDVPDGWLAEVGARVGNLAYRFEPADAGWRAANPTHGLLARFDAGGPVVADGAEDGERGAVRIALRSWGTDDVRIDAADAAWETGACDGTGRLDPVGACLPRLEADRGDGLREWWANDDGGLEQGWVVDAAPGEGDLVLELEIEGARAEVFDGHVALLRDEGMPLRYDRLAAWDADGDELSATFEPAEGGLAVRVDVAGARFPVTVDPTISVAWIASGSASSGVGFGVAGAGDVDGDGYDDVLVGAYAYAKVYAYFGSATGPSVSADWTATGTASTYFGLALALDGAGDVNGDGYDDVIVGAYGYDNGQTDEGAAYVYLGSASGPSTTAALTLESDQVSAKLGYAVAGVGDVNGDGYDDVLVGAPAYDYGHTDEGKAFLYFGGASGPDGTADWTGEGNQTSAGFGTAVAAAGDVDGDGYDDIAVAAPQYDDGSTDEGMVFVYHGSATGPSTSASWTAESDQASAYLGSALAGGGDVNADGYDDLLVSAYTYDNGSTDEGKAWVYLGSSTGLASTSSWSAEGNATSAYLGRIGSVALDGDVNADGYADVVIGRSTYSSSAGGFFVYHGSASGPATTASLTYTSSGSSYELGYVAANAGDTDGDGYDDVLVGAKGADEIWMFYGSADGVDTTNLYTWRTAGSVSSSYYSVGYAVEGAGDVNGDGYDDVLVSAPSSYYRYDSYVYVFHGSASGLSTSAATSLSEYYSYKFGNQMAGLGDVNADGYDDVAISAMENWVGYSGEGSVWVYYGSSSGISSGNYARLDGGQTNAYFGTRVDGAGDVNGDGYDDVIVGAYQYDDGQSNEGEAFVFYGSSGGVDPGVDWSWDCDVASCAAGAYVAGAGDVNGDGYDDVLVGATGWANGHTAEGAALLFLGSSSGPASTYAWSAEGGQTSSGCANGKGVGDVDADGYDDVLVGCYAYDTSTSDIGRVELYLGGSGGPSTTADWTDYGDEASSGYGWIADGLGDVNGDGYADFAVGAYADTVYLTDQGSVSVYMGGAGGPASAPDFSITEPMWSSTSPKYGYALANAGDVDGDGRPEMLVGAYDAGSYGYAYLYDFDDDDDDGTISWLDCDDGDADVHPEASEACDGIDNDCDGQADEETPVWYADADNDGYGDASVSSSSCTAPSGYVATDDDCDDADASVSPGATEVCGGGDEDCDGSVDELGASGGSTVYADADGDGYGLADAATTACSVASGYAAVSGDCDDADATEHPGATETCDGDDDDCDGTADEDDAADAVSWYADADGDGYGGSATSTVACDAPSGYVADSGDCNDGDLTVRPGAAEACDGEDDDCDGSTDEGVTTTYYADADGDGYGTTASATDACSAPTGYVATSGDCDDGDNGVRPGATEACDGEDDDCDGSTDEGVATTYYRDADGDGYGLTATTTQACSLPSGYAATAGDCDDGSATVYPYAAETCNSADDDCDGSVDDGVPTTTWYVDVDGDGYGSSSSTVSRCAMPSGYAASANDCDDRDAAVADGFTWYRDADQDGYGDAATTYWSCTAPGGYGADGTDCDDDDLATHPGADEVWYDDVDQACDGGSDYDADADGHDAEAYGDGDDCDDADADVKPGATEAWYDGVDQDCDGASDYDADADGQDSSEHAGQDCDDADADVYTGAPDDPYDGVVTDCASAGDYDADQDGYTSDAYGGADCDDARSDVYPGADELWYDGIDQNCDGNDADRDRDGTEFPEDCDDEDPDTVDCYEPDTGDGGDGGDAGDGGDKTDGGGGGCSSAGGGASALWAAFGAALALRRRRAA